MAKSKSGTSNIKKQQAVITQQQRNNNPIFKTVYKRIRNLNKKLTHIDSLLELDQATLKPEQIQKINSRNDVENQIRKNQEFASIYKSILDQNGSVGSQGKDDVVKIATLLAVGQWIDKTSSLGDNSELTDAYNSSYKSLLLCENNCKSIEAFIGDISTILNGFLKNQNQFNTLKSYAASPPSLSQKIVAQKSNKKQVRQVKIEPKIQQKVQQLKTQIKVQKKQEQIPQQKIIQTVKSTEKTQPLDNNSTPTQPAKLIQPNISTQEKTQIAHPNQPNPEHSQPNSISKDQTTQDNIDKQKPKKTENNTNRGYNKNYRNYNGNRGYANKNNDYYNNYNKNQQDNSYKNNKQYKPRNGYKNKDDQEKPRKLKQTRKDSDTSLEPTPEKDKVVQKPKYISKQ